MSERRSALRWLEDVREPLAAKHVLLLLDFDGTLSPIVDDPADARLPPKTRSLLAQLNHQNNVTVVLLSGRALKDLRARVGLKLTYAGNHGMEISAPDFQYENESAVSGKKTLATLSRRLTAALAHIPGAIIENKRLTLSVHFRKVDETHVPELVRLVKREMATLDDRLTINAGKKVLEIKPKTNWNKGSAAQLLRSRFNLEAAYPIAIGDDVTDEDLFQSVVDGVSIRVGYTRSSSAKYQLANCDEVAEFLERLLQIAQTSDSISSRPSAQPLAHLS